MCSGHLVLEAEGQAIPLGVEGSVVGHVLLLVGFGPQLVRVHVARRAEAHACTMAALVSGFAGHEPAAHSGKALPFVFSVLECWILPGMGSLKNLTGRRLQIAFGWYGKSFFW